MPKRIIATLLLVPALVAACSSGTSDTGPLRQGRSIYGAWCSRCHGNAGQGGTGPSLAGVLTTWPECADHIEWVTLGSGGWRAAHGDTYGATAKPVKGGMPEHESKLTLDERRLVATFERVTYGGADAAEALADCGVEQAVGDATEDSSSGEQGDPTRSPRS